MNFKVCGACAFYTEGSTRAMVQATFDSHSCVRRHITGMVPTMHPLEEASWVTEHLKRRGGVAVA